MLRTGCDSPAVTVIWFQFHDPASGSTPAAPNVFNHLTEHLGIFNVEIAGQAEMVEGLGATQHGDVETGEVSARFTSVSGGGHRPDRTGRHLWCLQPNIRSTNQMGWANADSTILGHR
jgi:hypothetical protein